jgi:hypothetical protein
MCLVWTPPTSGSDRLLKSLSNINVLLQEHSLKLTKGTICLVNPFQGCNAYGFDEKFDVEGCIFLPICLHSFHDGVCKVDPSSSCCQSVIYSECHNEMLVKFGVATSRWKHHSCLNRSLSKDFRSIPKQKQPASHSRALDVMPVFGCASLLRVARNRPQEVDLQRAFETRVVQADVAVARVVRRVG